MDSQVNRSLTVAAPSGFVFGGGHVGPIVNAPQAGLGADMERPLSMVYVLIFCTTFF